MADRVSDSVIFTVTGNYGRVGLGLIGGVSHRDPDGTAREHADIVVAVAEAENIFHRNIQMRSQGDHGIPFGAATGHDVNDFVHGSRYFECFFRGKLPDEIFGGLVDKDFRQSLGNFGKFLVQRDERRADLFSYRRVIVIEKRHMRAVRAVKDTVLSIGDEVKAAGNERSHQIRDDIVRKTVLIDRRILAVIVYLGAVTCDNGGGKTEFFHEFSYHMKGSSGCDRKARRSRKRADRVHRLFGDRPAGGKKRIINVTDDQTIQRKMSS